MEPIPDLVTYDLFEEINKKAQDGIKKKKLEKYYIEMNQINQVLLVKAKESYFRAFENDCILCIKLENDPDLVFLCEHFYNMGFNVLFYTYKCQHGAYHCSDTYLELWSKGNKNMKVNRDMSNGEKCEIIYRYSHENKGKEEM